MSAGLAAQQQALLAALWADDLPGAMNSIANSARPSGATASKRLELGLRAYRSHGLELAPRVLGAAFPVLCQLLDETSFAGLARAFWRSQPPQRGDLAQWGGELPAYLESAPQLAQEPYLGDVARVEWALHVAASAADAEPDPASLALLAQNDPMQLRLTLAGGVACVPSPWPVVSVIQAHRSGEPSLAQAGERLRQGVAETALVWRQGLQPQLREARPGEPAFLAALQAGQPLLQALDQAPGFDFSGWLAPAVQSGLLTGVQAACPPDTDHPKETSP
ncbi:MAG: putative DNA-binding domain-containing protein [Ramlibacter sp.]|nr:putative DNA-binding domain-containing protein [Ramlibacter sp.]